MKVSSLWLKFLSLVTQMQCTECTFQEPQNNNFSRGGSCTPPMKGAHTFPITYPCTQFCNVEDLPFDLIDRFCLLNVFLLVLEILQRTPSIHLSNAGKVFYLIADAIIVQPTSWHLVSNKNIDSQINGKKVYKSMLSKSLIFFCLQSCISKPPSRQCSVLSSI